MDWCPLPNQDWAANTDGCSHLPLHGYSARHHIHCFFYMHSQARYQDRLLQPIKSLYSTTIRCRLTLIRLTTSSASTRFLLLKTLLSNIEGDRCKLAVKARRQKLYSNAWRKKLLIRVFESSVGSLMYYVIAINNRVFADFR